MEEEINELILKQILKAIYWKNFTKSQKDNISKILNGEESNMYKANEICEYLDITKRDNRNAIAYVLNSENYKNTKNLDIKS